MYAQRKIVSASDMFCTGCLEGGYHLSFKLVPAGRYGVPDRVLRYVVCVYVLIFRGTGRIMFIDKYFALRDSRMRAKFKMK